LLRLSLAAPHFQSDGPCHALFQQKNKCAEILEALQAQQSVAYGLSNEKDQTMDRDWQQTSMTGVSGPVLAKKSKISSRFRMLVARVPPMPYAICNSIREGSL